MRKTVLKPPFLKRLAVLPERVRAGAYPFDLPILEYRPYRAFDTKQSSAVLIQLYAAADVPQSTTVTWPPGAPGVKLEKIYSIGLRLIFDWRRYF